MGVELASECDLQRRIDARTACKGERHRVKCRRCSKLIPDSRRIDARYCSEKCHSQYPKTYSSYILLVW